VLIARELQNLASNYSASERRMHTIAPRNFFHHDRLATPAIDAPHRVKQKNQKSPERNELETALGELVVSGGRLMAARTNGGRPLARTHGDLNALVIGTETGLPVNESGKTVDGPAPGHWNTQYNV
jgi:hypothetical protein